MITTNPNLLSCSLGPAEYQTTLRRAQFALALDAFPLLKSGLLLVEYPEPISPNAIIRDVQFDASRQCIRFVVEGAGPVVGSGQEATGIEGPRLTDPTQLSDDALFRLLHRPRWRKQLKHLAERILAASEAMEVEEFSSR